MSYSAGYNQVAQMYESRRSDAARAFNEYMKMNPQASAQDYQRYIDQLSGGSRYVRGGMPPQEVLQSLAAQNQRVYQQQQMAMQLEQMRAQQAMASLIDQNASLMALRHDNDMDIGNALVQSLGGGEDAFQMVKALYPSGFQGVRQRQQSAAILQYLPIAEKLYAADPNFDISSILPPELQGNKAVFSGLQKSLKEQTEAKKREQEYADYTIGLQRMKAQLDLGIEPDFSDVNPAVVPQLQNALTQYKANQQNVKAEADRIARSKNRVDLQAFIIKDPVSMAALKQPGTAGIERVKSIAEALGYNNLEFDDLAAIAKEAVDHVRVDMQGKLDVLNAENRKTAHEMLSERNNMAVASLSELYGDDGARLKEAGKYAPGANEAIQILARQFDLSTPAAVNAVQQAIVEKKLGDINPDGVSIAAHIASDENFLNSVETLEQAASGLQPAFKAAEPEKSVKSFEQYLSDSESEWAEQIENYQRLNVDPLVGEEIPDDAMAASEFNFKLANTKERLLQMANMLRQDYTIAQRSSPAWLDPTSQYDLEAAKNSVRKNLSYIEGLIETVNQKQRAINVKVSSVNKSRNEEAAARAQQESDLNDANLPASATEQQTLRGIPLPQSVNPNPSVVHERFMPPTPAPPSPPAGPMPVRPPISVPVPPNANPNPAQMQNRFFPTPIR